MSRFIVLAGAVLILCGCASQPMLKDDKEEARRAALELQSIMDMAASRQIPPVEFEFGSARLLETSYPLLDKVAEVLLQHNKLKLIVSGHTDDIGSMEFNDKLSLERAGAVKMYLAVKGVYPDSVRVYGYGYRVPVSRENTDKGRALNRRVEFRITLRDWGTVY